MRQEGPRSDGGRGGEPPPEAGDRHGRCRHSSKTLHRERGVDIRLGARLAAVTGDGAVFRGGSCGRNGHCRRRGPALRSEPRPTMISPAAPASRAAMASWLTRLHAAACRELMPSGTARDFQAVASAGRFVWRACRNAIDQAKTAASTILGTPATPMTQCPGFWSDQYEIKLQMAGLSDGL